MSLGRLPNFSVAQFLQQKQANNTAYLLGFL